MILVFIGSSVGGGVLVQRCSSILLVLELALDDFDLHWSPEHIDVLVIRTDYYAVRTICNCYLKESGSLM